MHVILMGPQGAGKGTQAERIAPRYNLAHLSTGDLFRTAIANETELGKLAKGYLDRGELVPDDVTIGIVDAKLSELAAGSNNYEGALLDGFPRTLAQAEGLDQALAKRGERIGSVVEISAPRDKLVARLAGRRVCSKCGATYHVEFNPPPTDGVCERCGGTLIQREDDTPDAINRRLDIYFAQTEPLLDYYEKRGLLRRVNGDRPIDEVSEEIEAAIDSAAQAQGNHRQ
jgi:adenylate kinase